MTSRLTSVAQTIAANLSQQELAIRETILTNMSKLAALENTRSDDMLKAQEDLEAFMISHRSRLDKIEHEYIAGTRLCYETLGALITDLGGA